jgi:hypothetical protein
MNTSTLSLHDPAATHRYQVYRQSQDDCHVPHGPILQTPEHAVALFLATAPVFEGGGVRLTDCDTQKLAASAEWRMEPTRMGFSVHTRANVFHEPALAVIAQQIAERERIEQAIANETMVTI